MKNMTVQEIFNSTAVRSVEEQILDLYHETERKHWCNDENKKAIKSLLEVRRRILNSMFVLDEQNKTIGRVQRSDETTADRNAETSHRFI